MSSLSTLNDNATIDNAYTLTFTDNSITGANLNTLDALTSVTLSADSAVSITTLNGLTVAATNAVDTFVFASGDTGITLSGLSTNDVLDVAADAGGNLIAHGSDTDGGNNTVDAVGEWTYSGTTFTYWDGGAAQTVTISSGLTLTTTGNDEVVTIG